MHKLEDFRVFSKQYRKRTFSEQMPPNVVGGKFSELRCPLALFRYALLALHFRRALICRVTCAILWPALTLPMTTDLCGGWGY
jgi:hypothetical protein